MLAHHHPNEFTYGSVLSSCDRDRGRQVHTLALKTSFDDYVYVGNALITMYFKSCCSGDNNDEYMTIFKSMPTQNLITWNSMIAGFQLHGLGEQALEFFSQMHHGDIEFDRSTIVSTIGSLCYSQYSGNGKMLSLEHCRLLHCLVLKLGFIREVEIVTALVKTYSKLGEDVAECYQLFAEASGTQDVVLWTAIITTFADRKPEEALLLFGQFRREFFNPDCYTFSIVIKACAGLATERHGSAVHGMIIKFGFEGDTVLANALIHAYARCGSIDLSVQVFNLMVVRDTVSWNSIFKAYALHGRGRDALKFFAQMNAKPDATTFVALLSACSHSGLVNEGTKIFDDMSRTYGISPQCDHFACMVDILGRAGHLLEAEALIKQMPVSPDFVVWSALLGACQKHGETKMAKMVSMKLMELEPKNSLGYVLMSNIYYSNGCFNNAEHIRKKMQGSKVMKEPGLSWIEIGNRVHEFASGGRHHPQREIIYSKLELLVGRLKEIGYMPVTSLALHDMEEEQKEEMLHYHSEKLALAFALINSGYGGSVIRIMKNIRICVDCHNFMKLASVLFQREIVVRDANRFHHFRNGSCSCSDYW
ncbi:Pentatricopeptide repeat-containing protein [Thalictrum thalictroides]|uniref:Pentatricopeptide repeat-containing protein n=1 Tax=Thalictrum thalictroides TaxID=46969 RepID=A0A7J6VQW7_THATH|nr:Pentatricopeptide repeat-containing protein [Thalictrum thalictroides]